MSNFLNRATQKAGTLTIGVIVATVGLAGCSRSVEHYMQNSEDLRATEEECSIKIISGKMSERDMTQDCKNAFEALKRLRDIASKKAEAEYAAKRAAKEEADRLEREKNAKEKAETEAKFQEIETQRRTAFDMNQKVFEGFSNNEIQARLNKFATALNKSDAVAAAAALEIEPTSVYPMINAVQKAGGVTYAAINDFSFKKGEFKFEMLYPGWDKQKPPTDYKVSTTDSSTEIKVELEGQMVDRSRPPVGNVVTWLKFTYRISLDPTTGKPVFRVFDYWTTTGNRH